MKRVKLDGATTAVKDFVRGLPVGPEPVELELKGRVLCTVIPSLQFSEAERATLLREGRELVRRARERTKNIPAKVIERQVRQAVQVVRRRQR